MKTILAAATLSLLIGGILGWLWYRDHQQLSDSISRLEQEQAALDSQITQDSGSQSISNDSTMKQEISALYTVDYPSDFIIENRSYDSFSIIEERWAGQVVHFPSANIRIYHNIIPSDMDLSTWFLNMSDPQPPLGDGLIKSCADFITGLKARLGSVSELGDGTDCFYIGAALSGTTTLDGQEAIRFTTAAVSEAADHTLVRYNLPDEYTGDQTYLFDIFYTQTGLSDANDTTSQAYQSLLDSFQIRRENDNI